MAKADPIDTIAAHLGYTFVTPSLLRDALTHRSYANEKPRLAPHDNERLEFLGDAVAALVVSTMLAERFPHAREGELTRRRADIVCETGLEAIARRLEIGAALRLGRGEERSGGRDKPRLLASALEAILAAVYLDGGADAALAVGRHLFATQINATDPGARDFKSRVQELVQARGLPAPRYRLESTEGPQHSRRFRVSIEFDGAVRGTGEGRSKVEAEQGAACDALEALTETLADETPVDGVVDDSDP
jgi:ribonuclease-3